jgi:hypothetical protein
MVKDVKFEVKRSSYEPDVDNMYVTFSIPCPFTRLGIGRCQTYGSVGRVFVGSSSPRDSKRMIVMGSMVPFGSVNLSCSNCGSHFSPTPSDWTEVEQAAEELIRKKFA